MIWLRACSGCVISATALPQLLVRRLGHMPVPALQVDPDRCQVLALISLARLSFERNNCLQLFRRFRISLRLAGNIFYYRHAWKMQFLPFVTSFSLGVDNQSLEISLLFTFQSSCCVVLGNNNLDGRGE
jgi:hypothetical protein